jgi:hypothetical protein
MLSAILTITLCSCGSEQSTRPTISPDLMNPPCKASDAGRDSDEDLQADTQTTECARAADKYLSLAGVVQGNGIANYYSLPFRRLIENWL